MNKVKINGKIRLQIFTKDGVLKSDTGFMENIITNAGKAQVALLAGAAGTPFTYLALGTSATAVAATDTTLGTEITDTGLARASATVSRTTTSVTNDTLSLAYSWTASGAKTIQEIGIFNASSSGTMLAHKLTGASTTANTDVVQATYTVQFS